MPLPFPRSPHHLRATAAFSAAALALAGCTGSEPSPAHAPPAAHSPRAMTTPRAQPSPVPFPGIGPSTLASLPSATRQVLIVTGADVDSSKSTAALYEHTAKGWGLRAGPWQAHNALRGWTTDHHNGDLRSPIGTFTLTDAGGLRPNPGTRLPYDHSRGFTVSGTGSRGEPLAGSFDYVVAINYNRKPGTTPLDWTRPLGPEKGGGIWLHVDHGGPTQGCISLSTPHMKQLLRALDPEQEPAVIMGDRTSLTR